jgi:predicted Zn-dependent peptidase
MKTIRPLLAVCAAGMLLAAGFSAGENSPQSSIRRNILPNGLTVVTQSDTTSAITVVEILVKGGAAAEPAGRAGISHLTTRLAMDIPDADTARDFMTRALQSTMISRDDDAVIQLEFLTEFAEPILAASAKIFADPLITDIRIDRLTESMNHLRRIEADDALAEAGLAQREAFFGGSPHAGSTLGTEDSVRALKVKEIRSFYEHRFVAGNIIVVAVSDLDPEALLALIARHFGKLRAGRLDDAEQPLSVKDPPYTPQTIEKEQTQSVVSCAFPLPPISRRNFARITLIENVLGRGAGSRLWSLRTEKKLAYSVSSPAEMFRRAGFLTAVLETKAEKTATAQDELAAALRDFRENGISAEEFAAGRAVCGADFLRTNETKSRRATTLGFFETNGLGAEFFDLFSVELASLTLEEINAEIKRLFDPARASWVIVGPAAK